MQNTLNTLKYGNVEIAVLSKGAELSSYKVDGKEFMWDRQPEFWAASSVVRGNHSSTARTLSLES